MAEIKYLDLNGLKALYGVVDSKIQVETNRATDAEKKLSDAIAAMDFEDTAKDGQFVTAVNQTDGQISVSRGTVAADKVTATAITGSATTVAVAGNNVAAQIASLGQTLKTVEGNAAKYEVEEVTTGLPANVRTRYQVVSYVGTKTDTNKTKVGEFIDIPKDGQLIHVEPTANGQGIKFTYSTGDGEADKTITIDLGRAIFESEIGSGLQVNESGVVSVKLAEGNESFLTVGADGVKLAGVQEAINTAVDGKNVDAEGDNYISATAANNKVTVSANVGNLAIASSAEGSTITGTAHSLVDGAEVAEKVAAFTNARISEEIAKLDATVGSTTVAVGKHVAVEVVEADGKLTAVSVNESDIASKAALDAEVTRAKAAEDTIEASVGLAGDGSFTAPAGNYINGAATVMDAVKKLDVQAKANADKIVGMSVDEDNQTVTIDSKSLKFVALTPEEIQKAADDAAGK